jgi:hypothetical protein
VTINVDGQGPYIKVTGTAPEITVNVTTGSGGGGGGGNASHWLVDWIGAFGPGFDALYDDGLGPFADPSLPWGPDYVLIQTPWGTWETYQAADGDTVACAAYLDGSFQAVPTNERIWTLTDGEWVIDGTQPTPGDLVTINDSSLVTGDWLLGTQMMLTGEGRMELTNLQHERAAVAQMSAIHTVTGDGIDNADGGAPWGTVLVDSTAGAVTRTLPTDYFPGRVIQYVKISGDDNPVIIEGDGTTPLLVPDDRVVMYLPGDTERFTFSGTYWYQIGGRYGSTTERQQDPHGIEDRTASTIAFDDTDRTFTITPTDDQFVVWCAGVDYTIDSVQSVQLPDTTDLYFIYFEDGVLDWTTGFPDWPIHAAVAYVYWNDVANRAEFVADERHGIVLDWATHEYLHRTRGAALASGFDLYDYTTTGSGSADAHAQVAVEAGTFFDEDLQVDVVDDATPTSGTWEQVLSPAVEAPVFYRSGNGWTSDAATTFPVKQGASRLQYNYDTGTGWSTQQANANRYVSSWLCATNIIDTPVIVILGQSVHTGRDAAMRVGWNDLDLTDLPVFEIRPLWHLVYQTGSYANTPHARLRAAVDVRVLETARGTTTVIDHGELLGLLDDDHPQYQRADLVVTATDPYTMTGESYVVTTGEDVTLPDAASMLGRTVRVGAAVQDVTVTTAGSDVIFDSGGSTDTVPYGTGGYYLAIDYFGTIGWSSLNYAGNTRVDSSAFSGNLSVTDNTLAAALATLDSFAPTPAAHASTHENGGDDEVALDASQVTSGVLDTARLASSGTADGTTYLRGDQTWATVAAGTTALTYFGTGEDGNVTISTNTTVTSQGSTGNGFKMYENLTVNNAVTMTLTGGIIFVRDTLTLNGTISVAGTSATTTAGTSGGAGPYSTTVSNNGGNGGTTTGSAATPTSNPSNGSVVWWGGAGGTGGTGTSGAGGAAGVAASITTLVEAAAMRQIPALLTGIFHGRNSTAHFLQAAGRGGGGGGGDGTAGGGGGGGGGLVVIVAREIAGTGTVTAAGGNGFTPTAGNRGGGGAGGGGFIGLITTTTTNPWTLTVTGGTGGSGSGTGTAGGNGATGYTVVMLGVA